MTGRFAATVSVISMTVLMALLGTSSASAHVKILYTFCRDLKTCPDGSSPSSVIADPQGNLYGTTSGGGAYGWGTVFELIPDAHRRQWTRRTLHDFCKKDDCPDGRSPDGPLIMDVSGNLYGTTYAGGGRSGTSGLVFELVPGAGKNQWTEKVLYVFCRLKSCKDGASPEAGLSYPGAASGALYDGLSPLYGTTNIGGMGGQSASQGAGVVFELQPPAAGEKKWTETALYRFCLVQPCDDGQFPSPYGQLAFDAQGNIFGTTRYGGETGASGVAFELSPLDGKWQETVLHRFCSQKKCADGREPNGNMTFDAAGALIGTAAYGPDDGGFGGGTLFKLVPNGSRSQYSVLHGFCSLTDCADGRFPMAAVLIDGQGNVFGTTIEGGANNGYDSGVLFEFNQSLGVLNAFCRDIDHDCADGVNPAGALMMDASGNIFGSTRPGEFGAGAGGSVFEFQR